MSGYAYLFVRRLGAPAGPIHFGHVGWGFTFPDDDVNHRGSKHYYGMCGSTENTSGAPLQPAGKTDAWAKIVPSAAAMFNLMRHVPIRHPPAAYDRYKRVRVDKPNVALARLAVKAVLEADYRAFGLVLPGLGELWTGSNCLDHAYVVLTAYGLVTKLTPKTTLAPNLFYDLLDAPDLPLAPDIRLSGQPQTAGAHAG